ncbi:MAG: 50S ribosomal protein L13 [Deltaproteobacteria bacterium]|nr:50S ribosomal protein L13 [Deltaproteobacteria bacterium]
MNGTFSAKPAEVTRAWFHVDASGRTLGRLASDIARVLRGKHKAVFTTHVDTGDFVIVTNVEKIGLTGNKLEDKKYYRFSGHTGGLRARSAGQLVESAPERVLELAVKGMLPKSSLGRDMLKKLKVYRGAEHPHAAQQPRSLPEKF